MMISASANAVASMTLIRLSRIMRESKYEKYVPNSVTILRPFRMSKESLEYKLMPWLLDMKPKDKEMRLFACQNFACKLPIDGYENIRKFIDELVNS